MQICISLVHKAVFGDEGSHVVELRVANHGSLRDPQELNLAPVYEDDRPAVPVAAVYGANASGKSTLVDAFRFFTDEKSAGNGASELYPLSDFKPRKGENFERRYLAGSYGAVPLLPETAFEDLLKKYWGAHGEVVPA